MRTELLSANPMQYYSDQHPSEDELERFLLHRMNETELEGMETHILACHNCVTRLEELELQITATKMALADLHQQTVAENYAAETAREKKSRWLGLNRLNFSWLSGRTLSFAGVAAAIALAITVAPRYTTVEKEMSAFRGAETNVLPAGRPVLVHLNAKDLPKSAVEVEIVNAEGNQIFESTGKVEGTTVDAKLPPIDNKGNYLLRLYSPGAGQTHGDLLREFSFNIE